MKANLTLVRMVFTYGIAILVLLGAYLLLRDKLAEITGDAVVNLVTFTFGLVLGFIFNRESSASGQQAQSEAADQGAKLAVTPYPPSGGDPK